MQSFNERAEKDIHAGKEIIQRYREGEGPTEGEGTTEGESHTEGEDPQKGEVRKKSFCE